MEKRERGYLYNMVNNPSIPSVFKKPIVSEKLFWIFLTIIFQKIFPNISYNNNPRFI